MNICKKSAFVSLVVTILFLGIVLVPAAGAAPEKSPRKGGNGQESDEGLSIDEWMQKHTVEVEATILYEYTEEGELVISETYSGADLKNKLNENKLTKTRKLSIPRGKAVTISSEGESFILQSGDLKMQVVLKSVVLVSAKKPYPWWKYSEYPQWTWSKVSSKYYEREDPINLIWGVSDLSTVKPLILSNGWYDWISEYTYYIYNPFVKNWVPGDGVADDPFRVLGGYHARLWQVGDSVVSNAHHDDSVFIVAGHQVDEYEAAEAEVAGFFGTEHESYLLDNECYNGYYNAYNDGFATLIT